MIQKKTIIASLKYILGLIFLIVLLRFTYANTNLIELLDGFKKLNWFWMVMILTSSILVHILRAKRWAMLLNAIGYNVGWWSALKALMIGYFVNLGIPRLGEVSRCLVLKEEKGIPIGSNFGTVLIERIIDIVSLMIFLILCYAFNYQDVQDYFNGYIANPIKELMQEKWLYFSELWQIILLFVTILLFLGLFLFIYRNRISQKIKLVFQSIWKGLTSIIIMPKKGIFILYTILIWMGYYLMTFWWFSAYSHAGEVNWMAGWVIVSVGNIGRTIPIQGGGAGAYHYLMAQVVLLYGLTEADGLFLAFAIHGVQTMFYLIFGLVFGSMYLFRKTK